VGLPRMVGGHPLAQSAQEERVERELGRAVRLTAILRAHAVRVAPARATGRRGELRSLGDTAWCSLRQRMLLTIPPSTCKATPVM